MEHILAALKAQGLTAVSVFPAQSYVVLSFAERLAQEVVGIQPILT